MVVSPGSVVPRSRISLGVEPALRPSLARLADGRAIVIDYFVSRTRRHWTVFGDITSSFADVPPGRGFVELANIEGIRIFVE
ncbi:MAG TPA: hypothetical protein VID95_10785, partial [Candidatus Limnocylindrales bacterium]